MDALEKLSPLAAPERLHALLTGAEGGDRNAAITALVDMLSSQDGGLRRQGYRLFQDGLDEALFQSCLNYRSLVRGFTHPLVKVLEETIERWACTAGARGAPFRDGQPPDPGQSRPCQAASSTRKG